MSELYILMLSIHGLIRGHDLELGRDADTGGQVLYVVELARSLARQHQIAKVDLVTRRIEDPAVSTDYAQPEESLGSEARIVRLRCGPRRYLRKESLWPYLDHMVDHALLFLREQKRLPDVIHSHYADAGSSAFPRFTRDTRWDAANRRVCWPRVENRRPWSASSAFTAGSQPKKR